MRVAQLIAGRCSVRVQGCTVRNKSSEIQRQFSFQKNKRDSEAGEVDLQHGQSILFGPRTGQASYSFHVADDRLSYTNNAAAAAAAANQSSSMGCGLLGLSGLEPIDGPGFRLCMSSRAGLTCSYPQAQK